MSGTSVVTALTVRVNFGSVPGAPPVPSAEVGLIASPLRAPAASCSPVKVMLPLLNDKAPLLLVSLASDGMPLMVSDVTNASGSLVSVTTGIEIESGIAASSRPLASCTVKVGPTGPMLTTMS